MLGEQDINVDGTEFILTDLAKFRQYIIRVVAYNANGPGTATSEVSCRTFSDGNLKFRCQCLTSKTGPTKSNGGMLF